MNESKSKMNRPEFELIDWIRSQVRERPPVMLGIGDDAASLQATAGKEVLVATDMLMEGVHFSFPPATAQLAGRKSLAVNLSDIAAMAGKATSAFVSVALPNSLGIQFARDVHTGILALADQYDVVIAGGDTNSWNGPLVISVTIVGEPLPTQAVRRSGAQPGDWLFVTGALGGSLPSGRHLTFTPRLREVKLLTEMVNLRAMIDISDGLAADLHHVLNASSVGADLEAAQIPLTEVARGTQDGRTPLVRGLSDGEDFELLFSVSPEEGRLLRAEWRDETPVTHIGTLSASPGCRLRYPDGRIESLAPIGWTHSLGT
jgi:thiamine-monophosphate kinase